MGKKVDLSDFQPASKNAIQYKSLKKPGRKKKPELLKMSKSVKLSLTEEEETRLSEQAQAKGLGLATFVRVFLKDHGII